MLLTAPRIKALSGLLLDIGNVFFASVFLGPLLSQPSWFWTFIGILLTVTSWFFGLKLIKD